MQYTKFLFLILLVVSYSFAKDERDMGYTLKDWETRQAIHKGLEFLVSQQDPKRGHFGKGKHKVYSISITSFACLSLMANGSLPGRGKYGRNVQKGLDYILRCVNYSGYISEQGESSRMHGHAFATLFLAEVYGMTSSNKVKKKLKKSIEMVIAAQTADGGWGYYPNSKQHEGSVTVCQVQALRSARNSGIRVPKKVIDRAVEYVRRSANPDGSFKYRLGMAMRRKSFPLAAAGVASLNATGKYDSKEIRNGLKFMMQYIPPKGFRSNNQFYRAFYYYGQYYAAQAMYHAPASTGYWKKWFPAVRKELLSIQDPQKGHWGKGGRRRGYSKYGPAYATAIATLILQIPAKYLPIFQR